MCARSAKKQHILLHLFLLRRLFVAPLVCFCAQREENFYFAVSLVAQTALCCTFFLARTARSNCLLHCDFLCLDKFSLYLRFWRPPREKTIYFIVPIFAEKAFCCAALFCARSARTNFILLRPFLLRQKHIVLIPVLCARSAKAFFMLLYPLSV